MMNKLGFLSLFLMISNFGIAQLGCNDPLADNYDALATQNDGSCTYAASNIPLTQVANLPADLNEISGMIFWNEKLYGHQDSGGPTNIYEFDTATGVITKTITLQGVTNVDWEDLTQDETHFYVGDFGNNANGNRTDLKIYKFSKSLITSSSLITIPLTEIEIINFAYEDQVDFSNTGGNNTAFDCEALAYNRGQLHLFTKNWIGNITAHYILPTTPGTYNAKKKGEYDVGSYKITGADFGADNLLALVGYQVTGFAICGLFLNYGFDDTYAYLQTGTMRFLSIGSALVFGQIEAITFKKSLQLYISNERFDPPGNFFQIVPQQFYDSSITNLIQPFYTANQQVFGDFVLEPGMLRYNYITGKVEGYDGSHWNPFH
jgi:hypothetical protein